MAKAFALLILLANLLALSCLEEEAVQVKTGTADDTSKNVKSRYSFRYGASDVHTGDIKAVWGSKEGDTVKGHYSVLEPNGSMRTVEYSASPKTRFTEVVNNENGQPQVSEDEGRSLIEERTMRDYGKYYDEDEDEDYYERKRTKHPFELLMNDYTLMKKPKYPHDLEPSAYTHSISINHPPDESSDSEAHSHVGYSFDPNCKTKTRKESHENKDNLYANAVELELSKSKYPLFSPASYKENNYDKYVDPSDYDFEKLKPFSGGYYKGSKYDDINIKPSSPTKYTFPVIPGIPASAKYYPADIPSSPKKKNRPYSEFNPSDDLDDYILVPKKKKYKPPRIIDQGDYRPELNGDYERPYYPSGDDDAHDNPYHIPTRGTGPKEVVRKIVKQRRPVINLLDIFDI